MEDSILMNYKKRKQKKKLEIFEKKPCNVGVKSGDREGLREKKCGKWEQVIEVL